MMIVLDANHSLVEMDSNIKINNNAMMVMKEMGMDVLQLVCWKNVEIKGKMPEKIAMMAIRSQQMNVLLVKLLFVGMVLLKTAKKNAMMPTKLMMMAALLNA